MSASPESRRRSSGRSTPGVIVCPACGGPLKSGAQWCPACDFTGGDTMTMFSDFPPPLLPILDAVGALSESDVRSVGAARDNLRRRFPQFHWRICIVDLPSDTSLPLFGFWLLNACPLDGSETIEDRAWTVLLLINAASGQAAAIPGYAAEPYVSDDEWKSILTTMAEPWQQWKVAEAIIRFFKTSRSHLDCAWKRYGARRSSRTSS